MMPPMEAMFSVFVLVGLNNIVSKRKHLLSLLLSLEFTALNLYAILCLTTPSTYEAFLMYFLIVVVCESAIAISLLVLLVRVSGNDLVGAFSGH